MSAAIRQVFSTEFATEYQNLLTQADRRDPKRLRFGSAAHHYQVAPPYAAEELFQLEAQIGSRLPDDYRSFVTTVSRGGVGPYYGLIPLGQQTASFATARSMSELYDADLTLDLTVFAKFDPWIGAIALAQLGCGYTALMVVNGPAVGQVWLDARSVGLVAPIAPTFSVFVMDWVTKLANDDLPLGYVPANACPLPNALSGYFASRERELGVATGEMSTAQLGDALAALGPGSIALASLIATPLHGAGTPIPPCVVCALLVESLIAKGLSRQAVAIPLPPSPTPS